MIFSSDFGFVLCRHSVLIYRAVNKIVCAVHAKAHEEPKEEEPFGRWGNGRFPAAIVAVIISKYLVRPKDVVDAQDNHGEIVYEQAGQVTEAKTQVFALYGFYLVLHGWRDIGILTDLDRKRTDKGTRV